MLSVYANSLVRGGSRDRAVKVTWHARWLFPAMTMVWLIVVAAWSFAKVD
jgi:hypothetical protein